MAVVGALVTGTLAAPVGLAQAVVPGCAENVITDVDGGGADAIVGLPGYDLPGKPDAGAIVVYSNIADAGESNPKAPTARKLMTADDFPGLSAQAGGRFGASVEISLDDPADGDACDDLVVGAPGTDVGGKAGAGEVYILRGSTSGLTQVATRFNEDLLGTPGGAQAGAEFGAALAVQTLATIAIGAPGRDVGAVKDAGRLVWLNYIASDLPPQVSIVEQGGSEAGAPEANDRFSEVLDLISTGDGAMVLIGVPHEDVGSKADAGAVGLVPHTGHLSMVTQDSPGAGGAAEAGDRYGAAIDVFGAFTTESIVVVAIGVPGEDVGRAKDAGALAYASFDLNLTPEEGVDPIHGLGLTLTQNSPGIPGSLEAGDAFGSAVTVGEFGRDNGRRQLGVSAAREDLGSAKDAGLVGSTYIGEQGSPESGAQPGDWSQSSAGTAGTPESGDRFGEQLSWVQLHIESDDEDSAWPVMLATVPGEDVGSVADAGIAYLGYPPGSVSVELVPPVLQRGAGLGMVPMQVGIQ
jgi:hypothetical protein